MVCLGNADSGITLGKQMEKDEHKKNAIEPYFIMVLYGVTIKHLQNIHKVMQSVDNTFISIIYFQIKSIYSKCMVQMLLSLCSL